MSTPQNPDDGNTPQDPSDPQNPYGPPPTTPPTTPPTSPTTPPPPLPPPPATPIPSAPSPYGDPSAPPAAPVPSAAPPPYGAPSTPASPTPPPAYGQPYVPMAPAQAEPGKGMAITALVLAILGCSCISLLAAVPLAITVLVRGRDGRNHGKGMAIAALVISVIYIVGWIIGGAAVYYYAKDLKSVNDLEVGDCINADSLTDSNADEVSAIRTVDCSGKHDGEVASTVSLTADTAKGDASALQALCLAGIGSEYAGVVADTQTYTVVALAPVDPSSGDKDVCIVSKADGSKLTGKLGS
jgi:hypothetical protein